MFNSTKFFAGAATGALLFALGGGASADTISPSTYVNDTLEVGDSVTISKTVVVEAAGPSDALIDIHFLIDTSGSMGAEIAAAKDSAVEIFDSLASLGDIAVGAGVYSEAARLTGAKPGLVINQDITTNLTTAKAGIDSTTLSVPDGGGDGPENGNTGIELAVENLSWRPGSNRFVFVLGDIGFKSSDAADTPAHAFDEFDNQDGDPISSNADVADALDKFNVDLYGLDFGFAPGTNSLTDSVEALGGTAFTSGASVASIVAAVTSGISTSLAEYEAVTIDDLGGGDPFIDVSVVCTDANTGSCDGGVAKGMFDRTVDREFTFDVTFERKAEGDAAFETFALVDGGIVAAEKDSFGQPGGGGGGGTPVVPLPAAGWMLIAAIGGLGVMRRRQKAA